MCQKTGGRVDDTETATAADATGVQYVTEQNTNNEGRPEFRVSNNLFFIHSSCNVFIICLYGVDTGAHRFDRDYHQPLHWTITGKS